MKVIIVFTNRLCRGYSPTIPLVLLFGILVAISGYAQKKSFKFTHFGKQDGLNQSSVNYIYQDSKGFVWIANFGGINRFDGYEFVSYTHSFNDSTSIADNSVWTILEKRDKTLWFGTKTGLSVYNETTNNFSNFVIQKLKTSSATLAVKALYEDKKGRFYIGSEGKGILSLQNLRLSNLFLFFLLMQK